MYTFFKTKQSPSLFPIYLYYIHKYELMITNDVLLIPFFTYIYECIFLYIYIYMKLYIKMD